MAEQTSTRSYRVLTVPGPDAAQEFKGRHSDLGTHVAARAEQAVEIAVAKSGIEGITRCVAIPVSNWTECSVEEDPRPRFRARRIVNSEPKAPAEDVEQPERPDIDQADAAGLT